MSRPSIPAALKRRLKEEAGYRCAVPTCRDKGPFDFEHIEEWSKVKEHKFENMLLLCVACHARVTRKEIHKSTIKTYKRNLAVVSGRYSLYEIRYLEKLYKLNPTIIDGSINIDSSHDLSIKMPFILSEAEIIHMDGLLKDGYINCQDWQDVIGESPLLDAMNIAKKKPKNDTKLIEYAKSMMGLKKYMVLPTDKGLAFARQFFRGEKIE